MLLLWLITVHFISCNFNGWDVKYTVYGRGWGDNRRITCRLVESVGRDWRHVIEVNDEAKPSY